MGRLVFDLYDTQAPKTVENFRALSTGELGKTGPSAAHPGVPLSYKESTFHRR